MTRNVFLSSVSLSLSIAAVLGGCTSSTPVHPPVLDSAAPDSGVDAAVDAAVDVATQDIAPPDVTSPDVPLTDVPPTDVPLTDASPTDVTPLGTAWCDLPAGPDATVTGAVLPAGFCIRRYGRVRQPRVLAFAPSGDLFVSSPQQEGAGGTGPGIGAIVVMPDDNHDGVADSEISYLDIMSRRELETVHGLLFHNGNLVYTSANEVYQVPYTNGDRHPGAGSVIVPVADLTDAERWTHTLTVQGDTILVSMGIYGASQCPIANPRQGAVLAIGPGHPMMGDIVARGFRNPMYIRCQPWGTCYAAELTDDGWFGPGHEKIVTLTRGDDYGYPCCYDRGMRSSVEPTVTYDCGAVQAGIDSFPVSYTPFGHDFEHGGWPAPYAGGLFVGLHGQVGSWDHTGLQWAPVDPTTHRPTAPETEFVGGWGAAPAANVGRIADVVFAPDGRLFFSDDQAGAVYWIAPRTLRMPTH